MTLFKSGQEKVLVKARGQSISRAVDTVEVLRNRFMPSVVVEEIKIGTEQIQSEERNTPSNVSTIEIVLKP
jgi:DNA-binding protein